MTSEVDANTEPVANGDPVCVLVIAVPDAQKYLTRHNRVLEALYGEAPYRFELTSNPPWELLIPDLEDDGKRLKLLDRFGDVTARELPEFIKSDRFIRAVYHEILELSRLDMVRYENAVRVILIDRDLWDGELPLRSVCGKYFPDAAVFGFERLGRSEPVILMPESTGSED